MIRVMFYIGVSVLLASAVLLYLPICFSYILLTLLAVAFVLLLVLRNKITFNGIKTLILLILVFVLLGISVLEFKALPLKRLEDKMAVVEGTVSDWPTYNGDYTTYTIKADKVIVLNDKQNVEETIENIKIRISDVYDSNFDVFQKVKINVQFHSIDPYKSSSYANGIFCSGYTTKKSVGLDYNRPFYAVFYDLRKYVNRLIFDNINYKEATLASAVLMGDFEYLDEEFYSNSKATGTTHMLVVSGMHLGIIFQVLGILLKLIKFPKRIRALVLILAIFSVCAICGFTPSILRAGLTYFIMALGMFLYKKPDPLNSLGLSAVIICFISPFSAGNIAFLLSFFSTFGLIYVCPLFYSKFERFFERHSKYGIILRGSALAFCQTLSASICTMPISVIVFGYISTVSLIANVLVGYAMSLVLVLTLIIVVMLWFPIKISSIISVLITALCLVIRYAVFIINSMANIPNSVVGTELIYLIPWCLVFVGIISSTIAQNQDLKEKISFLLKRISICLIAVSVCLFMLIYYFYPRNKISVLSVGKGNSIIINIDDEAVVIGCGDGKNDIVKIKNSLLKFGKNSPDVLVLPTLDKAFAGGGAAFVGDFSDIDVILPNDAQQENSFKYVDNGKYRCFEDKAVMSVANDLELLIYKDKGVIIDLLDETFVIAYGDNLGDFYNQTKDKKITLICSNNIPKDIMSYSFDRIVFSGDSEKMQDLKNSICPDLSIRDSFEKNITFKIG